MSQLGSTTILSQVITFPQAGGWHADLTLDHGALPTGAQVLTTGSLTLHGKVLRAKFDTPDRPHVVLVGGAGWQGLVQKPISYQSDAGVRLSTALSALSTASGQPIEQPADRTIGDYFEVVASRTGEPVRFMDVLAELVRAGYIASWRVDPDGVTRFGPRTPKAVAARLTLLHVDGAVGMTTYGTDDPADFLPGNTIDGVPIARSVIRETASKLEVDIFTTEPDSPPSIRDQMRRILASLFQEVVRTYHVASVGSDGRVDLTPPPDATHLPEMKNVEPWSLGGTKYEFTQGEEVVVVFRDERKTRPIVLGTKLGSGPFAGIARLGDTVTVLLPPATFSGTIGPTPASGMVVWAPGQTMGNITAASAKTKAGP